jgi:hypothetical protein
VKPDAQRPLVPKLVALAQRKTITEKHQQMALTEVPKARANCQAEVFEENARLSAPAGATFEMKSI